jgi:hypothetical protein
MTSVHLLPDRWLPVSIAPSDTLCVIDKHGIHALVFPCRENGAEWLDVKKNRIDIQPTHSRKWSEKPLIKCLSFRFSQA